MNPRRRLVAFASMAWPLLLQAQPGRARRIGVLVPAPGYPDRYEALKAGLAALGWVEGKNLAIEWRHAEGKYDRLSALTEELVKAGAELIVTNSTIAVTSARKAAATVPIVAAAFGDPVASGFAASLARPGGSITGVSIIFDGIGPKMLELAFTVLPRLARPAILQNSRGSAFGMSATATLHELAVKARATPLALGASTVEELDTALATAVSERADALLVMVEPFMVSQRHRIAEFALKRRLPAFAQSTEFVESGFLASYGPDFRAAFRRSASFVDRILKGAKPGDLPVEQTTALELAINQKTATAIGIAIPQSLLLRADRVIE